MRKKTWTTFLAAGLLISLLSGCSGGTLAQEPSPETSGEKSLVWGDTTFNAENGEPDINPHRDNSGWACIRYGVGETLFRFSDSMEIEPWLAKSYENTDELTWVIQLREDVDFASGRHMDAQSVKECLEDLISVHVRAAEDLQIREITAEGYTLTIHTAEPVPALIHYLAGSLRLRHRHGGGSHRGGDCLRHRTLPGGFPGNGQGTGAGKK